jgi:hypothetical protein
VDECSQCLARDEAADAAAVAGAAGRAEERDTLRAHYLLGITDPVERLLTAYAAFTMKKNWDSVELIGSRVRAVVAAQPSPAKAAVVSWFVARARAHDLPIVRRSFIIKSLGFWGQEKVKRFEADAWPLPDPCPPPGFKAEVPLLFILTDGRDADRSGRIRENPAGGAVGPIVWTAMGQVLRLAANAP